MNHWLPAVLGDPSWLTVRPTTGPFGCVTYSAAITVLGDLRLLSTSRPSSTLRLVLWAYDPEGHTPADDLEGAQYCHLGTQVSCDSSFGGPVALTLGLFFSLGWLAATASLSFTVCSPASTCSPTIGWPTTVPVSSVGATVLKAQSPRSCSLCGGSSFSHNCGRSACLLFQYASFNNSRSLHFFLALWPVVGIWFTSSGSRINECFTAPSAPRPSRALPGGYQGDCSLHGCLAVQRSFPARTR